MNRALPQYTNKQELWNSITHLLGVVFSFAVLGILITIQVKHNLSFRCMYPFYIYFLFMFMVFMNSTIYHSCPQNSKIRVVCRVFDHCGIYLFVAGTYTPICLRAISDQSISIALIVIQWSLAIAGFFITIFGLGNKKCDLIGYIIYIIQGWAVIFFYPFKQVLDFNVFIFILCGGLVYTVGAISYAIGKKNKWFHVYFHIFILVAAVIQFIGIFNILCPFFS